MTFNPDDAAATDSGIFGLPYTIEQAKLVLIPVPWEATTSYGGGTAEGPEAILHASHQVDLYDLETGSSYEAGIAMLPAPENIRELNTPMKKAANKVRAVQSGESEDKGDYNKWLHDVNHASEQVNYWVHKQATELLAAGKIVGVVGGDHSSPLGAMRALSEKLAGNFGVLHIDAHADLREAYQGFRFSHASIMYNLCESDFKPRKLVQVGIRDFSQGEYTYIQKHPQLIKTFFDQHLKQALHNGETWSKLCRNIVSELPENVYVSFDIDGLSPDLCPNTGTPVPGGLSFEQALTLLSTLHSAGKRIVGFDLCEVAQPLAVGTGAWPTSSSHGATPASTATGGGTRATSSGKSAASEWDANVGARVLFKLCGWALKPN